MNVEFTAGLRLSIPNGIEASNYMYKPWPSLNATIGSRFNRR